MTVAQTRSSDFAIQSRLAKRGCVGDLLAPAPAALRARGVERVRGRRVGPVGAPVIAVLGGISADRFVADDGGSGGGWWSAIARRGGAIDLDRFAVAGLDFAPEAPETPIALSSADQAALFAAWLDAAGIARLHAFVGASYGGQVGLAFAAAYPERLERLVVISAAHRPHPMATAWRGIQRRILEFAIAAGEPERGVALARELAMTTYRTPEEFAARFDGGLDDDNVRAASDVCAYLMSRGDAAAKRMSAARYLSLSASLDRHDVTPEAISTPTLVIDVASDRLVPSETTAELAARLAGPSRRITLRSLFGHDAFLKETDAIDAALRGFLQGAL